MLFCIQAEIMYSIKQRIRIYIYWCNCLYGSVRFNVGWWINAVISRVSVVYRETETSYAARRLYACELLCSLYTRQTVINSCGVLFVDTEYPFHHCETHFDIANCYNIQLFHAVNTHFDRFGLSEQQLWH